MVADPGKPPPTRRRPADPAGTRTLPGGLGVTVTPAGDRDGVTVSLGLNFKFRIPDQRLLPVGVRRLGHNLQTAPVSRQCRPSLLSARIQLYSPRPGSARLTWFEMSTERHTQEHVNTLTGGVSLNTRFANRKGDL